MNENLSSVSPPSRSSSRRYAAWVLALAVVVVLAVLGITKCVRSSRLTPAEMGQTRGVLAGWNVVLISIDTLRADHLACYGHRDIKTPVIDRLAAKGIRFAHAVSPVPLTLPSHATMLTGLIPPHHGVRNNGTFRLEERFATLPRCLSAAGYRTGAAVSAFVMDRRFGLDQGFEYYDDDLTVGEQPSRGAFRERRAELTNSPAIRWLRQHANERFFLFVHYYDPHWPYTSPSPYREQYAKVPYDGAIAYVDEQIGKLLAEVDGTPAGKRTLVIVTSDHGESLGEHGEASHGIFIYDPTQLVPLIFAGPSRLPRGVVIDDQVGLVDIMPTVLDLLGVDKPLGLDGINAFARPSEPRLVYMESLGAELMHGCAPLFGVRRADAKFILAPRPELYDLRSDPQEKNNLYPQHRDLAEGLYASLRTFAGDDLISTRRGENLPISEEVADKLRALGYVTAPNRPTAGASATTRATRPPADPKDMIVHLRRSQRAQELIMRGQFEEGLQLLEEHRKACPEDVMSLHRLAEGYRTVGRFDEALSTYRSIIARSPSNVDAIAGAASVLLREDKIAEAEQEYRRILVIEPDSLVALSGLGSVQAARKQYEAALATFRRVTERAQGQRLVNAYTNMGLVYSQTGRPDEARQAYRKALSIDPGYVPAGKALAQLDQGTSTAPQSIEQLRESLKRTQDPDGFLALGQLLRQAGRFDEAEAPLRRALIQRPGHAETHFELGAVLAARSKNEEAEAMLRRCIELDPNQVAGRSELAVLLARRGQLNEAAGLVLEAIKLAPEKATLHYNLGIIEEELGQIEKAVALYKRATELDPRHAQAHFHLGQLLARQNQHEQAREYLRKAVEIKPDYAEARAALDQLK